MSLFGWSCKCIWDSPRACRDLSHSGKSTSSSPKEAPEHHPCLQMVVWWGSTIWSRWKYPYSPKRYHICGAKIWFIPLPGKGSRPSLTEHPSPTLQARPSPIKWNDFTMDFQKIEPPLDVICGFQIQSIKEDGEMYFCKMTSVHWIDVEMSRHPHLVTRAVEKWKISFNPHPPKALGMEILSHFTQGLVWISFFPCQRKVKQMRRIFSRMLFGIQAMDI